MGTIHWEECVPTKGEVVLLFSVSQQKWTNATVICLFKYKTNGRSRPKKTAERKIYLQDVKLDTEDGEKKMPRWRIRSLEDTRKLPEIWLEVINQVMSDEDELECLKLQDELREQREKIKKKWGRKPESSVKIIGMGELGRMRRRLARLRKAEDEFRN